LIQPVQWRDVDRVPPLAPGQVHLWWQDLRAAGVDVDALFRLLSQRERERVQRFRVTGVGRDFAAARGLLKRLLSGYLARPPAELRFRYGPLGKPSMEPLDNGDELCFNYTDTGGFALYAFAWNRELGVDLELLSRQGGFDRIIERYFAPAERRALLSIDDEAERRRCFLACWTRKEGYGKALGLGIRFPFDCREMCQDCSATPLAVNDHVDGAAWEIHQLYPTSDAVAALVQPSGRLAWRCLSMVAGAV